MDDLARPPGPDAWLTLAVAFGDSRVAGDAWAQLAHRLDIDTVDFDVHSAFPQLSAGLRRLGVESHIQPRLDGVRRRMWTRNSLRVREVLGARDGLAGIGIPAEPTAGLGLLLRQADLGARPLVDAELQVNTQLAREAATALGERGWREVQNRRDGWLRDLHAWTFERAGHQLTLRWSDGAWPYGARTDERRASPTGGPDVAVPDNARLLAYTLVEGYQLWGYRPVRRYADALMCLTDEEGLDWDEFLRLVGERGGASVAHAALEHLAGTFPGLMPPEVVSQLANRAGTLRSRLAVGLGRRSGTAAVLVRRTDTMPTLRAIGTSPRLLRELWGVDSSGGLALAGARRLRGRPGPATRRAGTSAG